MLKWFYFSDMQIPDQDDKAIDLAFKVLKWFKPNVVVNIGDLANGSGTSRWANGTTEEVLASILEENTGVIDYWRRVKKAAPRARLIWTGGNHDQRPFDYVDKKAPALRELVTPESLWKIDELNVEYYDYSLPPQVKMGDVYLHHGAAVSKHAGDSVRADIESWGVSVIRGHCFSDDTQILTRDGWKDYTDVLIGTEVYTLNENTMQGEYQSVSEKFVYSDYQELISIKNSNLDVLVTPLHQMLSVENGKIRRQSAREMSSRQSEFPLAVESSAPDANISDTHIKMLSWVIAEGNFDPYTTAKGKTIYRIRLSQSDAPDGRLDRLTNLMRESNLSSKWIKRYSANTIEHGTHRNFDAYRTHLRTNETEWIFDSIDPKTKNPIGELLRLSSRQARLFLMEYVWSDGCKNSSAQNSYQLATNNIGIRDYLQKLCAIAGWRSSAIPRPRGMWCLTFNTNSTTTVREKNFSVKAYSGNVWCVTVPNHTLVVRRNGKTFIAGNSHRASSFAKTYELRNETLWGYEIGHLMDVSKADYSQVHNWQQAFAVGYEEDGHGHIDIIPIHPGYVCYYGGRKFSLDEPAKAV